MSEIDYDRLAEAIDRRRTTTTGGASDDGPDVSKTAKNINFIDKAFGDLGKGLSSTVTQLNYGQAGLSSLNYAVQGAQGAFSGFSEVLKSPLLKGLLQGGADAVASYVQAVNQSVDAQYAAYQTLAKVGAADQFSGLGQVTKFADQLGFVSRADLPKFAALVADSSESLARLGGTVEGGLKQFAALGQAIQKTAISTEMARMGYDPQEQSKALAGLVKNISAAGGSLATLGKTADQQAASVLAYIKQQDEVTRLTGLSVEAQQKAYDQALTNDRFAIEEYQAKEALAKAKAEDDGSQQAQDRIARAQARTDFNAYLAAEAKAIGGAQGKAMLDLRTGAMTKEAQQSLLTFGPEYAKKLQANERDFAQQALDVQQIQKTGTQKTLNTFGNLFRISPEETIFGPVRALTQAANRKIATRAEITAQTKPVDESGKPVAPEANLANVVAARQNLAEITSALNSFINEGIGPITNKIVAITQQARETAVKFAPERYMTKEQRARYEAETGANAPGVGLGKSEVLERKTEEVRQEIRTKIESAKEVVNEVIERLKDAGAGAAGAVDDVTKRLKKSLEDMRDTLKNLNQSMPNSPASGVSFSSSSMSRLLNDYRNAAGPENRYEPSLVDTVYRPNVNDQENRAPVSDFVTESGQSSQAQLVAYQTMIGQQAELIDLLSRSVGIQDRTLRATYNA
jgi:hypothetical protein